LKSVSLADAKAHLSALVTLAEAGEAVEITRRGVPVAQIVAVKRVSKPIDVTALRALTEGMTFQTEDAGTFMRRVRDEDRY
jgi:prevent-host-death family protein